MTVALQIYKIPESLFTKTVVSMDKVVEFFESRLEEIEARWDETRLLLAQVDTSFQNQDFEVLELRSWSMDIPEMIGILNPHADKRVLYQIMRRPWIFTDFGSIGLMTPVETEEIAKWFRQLNLDTYLPLLRDSKLESELPFADANRDSITQYYLEPLKDFWGSITAPMGILLCFKW